MLKALAMVVILKIANFAQGILKDITIEEADVRQRHAYTLRIVKNLMYKPMKSMFWYISNREPLDVSMRLYEFFAGISKRETARLEWMQQVARQRGDYFTKVDRQAVVFRQMLAESIYPGDQLFFQKFIAFNTVRLTLDEIYNQHFKTSKSCYK